VSGVGVDLHSAAVFAPPLPFSVIFQSSVMMESGDVDSARPPLLAPPMIADSIFPNLGRFPLAPTPPRRRRFRREEEEEDVAYSAVVSAEAYLSGSSPTALLSVIDSGPNKPSPRAGKREESHSREKRSPLQPT